MNQSTARDVANFFLHLDEFESGSEGISNLKMQKLVYYAFGFYAAIYDIYLFEDPIEAWMYGPVVPTLYKHYKACNYGKDIIPFDQEVPTEEAKDAIFDILNEEQRSFIKEVFDEFAQYSAWKLAQMTHEETPWMAYVHRENKVIPPEEIKEYFLTRI